MHVARKAGAKIYNKQSDPRTRVLHPQSWLRTDLCISHSGIRGYYPGDQGWGSEETSEITYECLRGYKSVFLLEKKFIAFIKFSKRPQKGEE